MGNKLATLPDSSIPAYLQETEAPSAEGLITSAEALPKVSIRGKQFRLIKDGEERAGKLGAPMSVVILGVNPPVGCAKVYYQTAYSQDSKDAPDCSSSDGVRPDSWIQNPQSDSCAVCPYSAWGSARDASGNPAAGKACADIKTLLVVAPNAVNGDIYTLQVPPSSLKALSNYGRQLVKHNVPLAACLTTLSFADSEYPKLEFSFGGFLDQETGMAALERSQSEEVQLHVESALTTEKQESEPVSQTPPETPLGGESTAQPADLFSDSAPAESQAPVENSLQGGAVDASGASWNPEIHATGTDGGPVYNKDGTFRRRRKSKAAKATAQAQVVPSQPASQPASEDDVVDVGSELDDILSDWG